MKRQLDKRIKVGQNKQQSSLSVLTKYVTSVKKDLWIYYSVELTVQINVDIGTVCRPLSMEGRQGTELWFMTWVGLEIFEKIYILI